jgi:hypothetical protein
VRRWITVCGISANAREYSLILIGEPARTRWTKASLIFRGRPMRKSKSWFVSHFFEEALHWQDVVLIGLKESSDTDFLDRMLWRCNYWIP